MAFRDVLSDAIVAALVEFIRDHPSDTPYAFALVGGPAGEYLGYAIASDEGLSRVASQYDKRGYRYQGHEWEIVDNIERLRTWLRWANPDDGWLYGDFSEGFAIPGLLQAMLEAGEFGEAAEDFEEFCTASLEAVLADPELAGKIVPLTPGSIVFGFTYGEDPRDFLRTATRVNSYPVVKRLWNESWQAEEIEPRFKPPGKQKPLQQDPAPDSASDLS